jgi:PAS domain S-box-containing protein
LNKKDEKIERLNLVLRAIRNVNQLLIREKDRTKLLQGACDNLIENRGYHNAWIALLDESGRLVTSAESGLGKEFLPMVEQLTRGAMTECGQKALNQSGLVLTQDPLSDCKDCLLSEKYAGRGAITVRLEHGGKIYGILCVSIPREVVPDEEEHGLLEEVAGDIAFGLHGIEMEEERRRAEAGLQHLAAIVNSSDDAIISKSLNGIIMRWNQSAERIYGYTEKEVVGKPISILIPKDRPDEVAEILKKIARGEQVDRFETVRQRKDGTFVDVSVTISPMRDKEGKILGASTIARDITERKLAEKALRESQNRFRDLIENSLIGTSIVQDDQVVYQNPEQERLLGPLPRKPKLIDLKSIHSDDVGKAKEFYQNMTSGEVQTQETEFRFFPVDESGNRLEMKWVYCRTSSIEYRGREAILVNMMDVTRTKELENILRIQDKMSSLGRVSAGIAHEIRNPLSGINIYLGTLEKMYDREDNLEKVKQIFDQLKSASDKIESVIRRVMDFSKPSEPKLVLTDINKPIEEALNLSSVTLRKRGIKLEKALAEDMQPCRADPHLIEQVILNLITNAAEAMKNVDGAKVIEVTSSMENNCVIVKVSDSGPGVPLHLREKIFDPFYTTKNSSTGIGLSLSHRIITDHGGYMNIYPSKWGGAEFKIEIPIGKARAQG